MAARRMHCVSLWVFLSFTCVLTFAHSPLDLIPLPNFATPPLGDIITMLSTLRRKPTCYRTAAASLIHHCTSLTSDIPDPDRVHFAVKLTCCELDLINQTPAVCQIESHWRECVRILASKDHWWTTFSGNLREVTNVCWIGRQEVEKGEFHLHDAFLVDTDWRSIVGFTC